MTRLLDLLSNLLLLILSYCSGHRKGELNATIENIQTENEKLAQSLKSAMGGDYTPDAIARRMHANRSDEQ